LGVNTTTEEGQVEQIAVLIKVVEKLLNEQNNLTEMQRKLLVQVLRGTLVLLKTLIEPYDIVI